MTQPREQIVLVPVCRPFCIYDVEVPFSDVGDQMREVIQFLSQGRS